MKIKNFLTMALVAFVFASCSDDEMIPEKVKINPTGKAWLALSIKTSTGTRAFQGPEAEEGQESNIKRIKAILFDDSADPVVLDEVDITTAAGIAGTTPRPSTPFEVPSESKKLLIIVNGNNLPLISKGMTYSQVNKVVTASAESLIGTAKDEFMMTNSSGTLLPKATDLELKDKPEDAVQVSVKVDRLVAKVRVSSTYAAAPGTPVVSELQWVLNVTNKKYFPVSLRTKSQKEIDATTAGTFIPIFSDEFGDGSYRIDPNYATQPSQADYNDHYTVYSETNLPANWNNVKYGSTQTNYTQYCLENTQNAVNNTQGYTTQILLRAKVFSTDTQAGDVSGNAEGHFFKVSGHYFTFATLWTLLKEEQTKENKPYTAAFNQYLSAMTITPLVTDATTDAVFNDEIKTAVIAEGSGVEGAVSFYNEGISYYRIMIKHDSDIAELNGLGKFGVVRNSIYDVNISQFSAPGEPIVPNPDPGKEDEDEEYYLKVQIDVNQWNLYTQDEKL